MSNLIVETQILDTRSVLSPSTGTQEEEAEAPPLFPNVSPSSALLTFSNYMSGVVFLLSPFTLVFDFLTANYLVCLHHTFLN